MKSIFSILSFIAIVVFSLPAFAQNAEVVVNIEYSTKTFKLSTKDNDPQAALVKAIQNGCKRLCNDKSCETDCYQKAKLTILTCIDENNVQCRPNQEKARKKLSDIPYIPNSKGKMAVTDKSTLLDSNSESNSSLIHPDNKIDHHKILHKNNIKSKQLYLKPQPNTSKDSLLSTNPRKQHSSTLLLSNWRGKSHKNADKKKKSMLLLDNKPTKLMSTPSSVRTPLLLK